MIDLTAFRLYVNDQSTADADLERALSTGIALVDVTCRGVVGIPDAVMDQAYLICASRIHANQAAPDGVSQFASADGTPRYIARDPLEAVMPLVTPYFGWFA